MENRHADVIKSILWATWIFLLFKFELSLNINEKNNIEVNIKNLKTIFIKHNY